MTRTIKNFSNLKWNFTAILLLAAMASGSLMLLASYFYYQFYFKWVGRFNSEGRFFDARESVVYTDDGDVMIIPVILLFLVTLVLIIAIIKSKKRKTSKVSPKAIRPTRDVSNKFFHLDHKTLIGSRVIALFQSKKDGPFELLPGLGHAYYYSVIIEVEKHGKFVLHDDALSHWYGEEGDFEQIQLLNACDIIDDIIIDSDGQMKILLRNGYEIYFETDYGSRLFVGFAKK